jgi:hypothetical protein
MLDAAPAGKVSSQAAFFDVVTASMDRQDVSDYIGISADVIANDLRSLAGKSAFEAAVEQIIACVDLIEPFGRGAKSC